MVLSWLSVSAMAQSTTQIIQTTTIGLPSLAVAVSNNYLYVQSSNPFITPYSLGNPNFPAGTNPVSYSGDVNTLLHVERSFGNHLYACGGVGNIFRIFDLANPAIPNLTGTVPIPAQDVVAIDGYSDYAYLGSGDSLFIVDVSNKANPVYSGFVHDSNIGSNPVKDLYLNGIYLYIAADNKCLIYEITTPTQPTYVGELPNLNSAQDLTYDAQSQVLIVATGPSFSLFDISNPAAPVFVGTGSSPNGNPIVHAGGGYILQGNNLSGSTQGVASFTSDPVAPVLGDIFLGNVAFSIRNIASFNNFFYVCKLGGVEVLQIGPFVGVEDGLELEAKWYPNPANERAFLQLPEGLAQADVQLYNQIGQVVRSWSQETVRQEVDLSQLAPGPYFIEINSEGYRPQRELIIVQ